MFPPGFMREQMHNPQMYNSQMHDSHMHKNDEQVLAMAYVPRQKFREIYECDKALMRGTIYCELDKPFRGSSR